MTETYRERATWGNAWNNIKSFPKWGALQGWNLVIKPEHVGKSGTQLMGEAGAHARKNLVDYPISLGKAYGGGLFGTRSIFDNCPDHTGIVGVSKGNGSSGGGGTGKEWWNLSQWIRDRQDDASREYDKRLGDPLDKLPNPDDFKQWIDNGLKGIIPEGGLVTIPPLDLTPVKDGMSDFAMALAMGLGSLGQGIGGAVPSMPSITLTDDEGAPNILLLGGLAAVAYIVLKKVK